MKKLLTIIALLFASTVFASTENLDEMVNRVSRRATNTFGYQYLENASNNYIWQPETLQYFDTTTGNEVWRLSNIGPVTGGNGSWIADISWPQWSADGKRFLFSSSRYTAAWSGQDPFEIQYGIFMVMLANGSNLRPMPNAASRGVHSQFATWNPAYPDVMYQFGRNFLSEGLNNYDLYKVTVGNTSESKALFLSFPSVNGELNLEKAISSDGTSLMAQGGDGGNNVWMFPATVYPDVSKSILVAGGYTMTRPTLDPYWGNLTSWQAPYYLHDQYLYGAGSNIWWYFVPENTNIWWRMKLTGTDTDGGPKYTSDHTVPYSWGGELEPLNGGTGNIPYCPGTNCSHYWSHPSWDRWNRYVAFNDGDASPEGAAIWDMTNNASKVASFGGGSQHTDWHAWSDWATFSTNTSNPDQAGETISIGNLNNSSSRIDLCEVNTWTSSDGSGGAYNRLARPTQSPDGTKINFHSTYLNDASGVNPDVYYVVAYYPYPPEIYQATAAGGNVTLTFDHGENSGNPRGYSTRKWPDESTGTYPPPRETKQFRLWSSANGTSGWTPVATTAYAGWTNYNFSTGVWTGNAYQTVTTTQSASSTVYYALTAQENSGLEGTIGNVWKVTLTNGGAISSALQQTAYPSSPGAKGTHWTTAPGSPTGLTVAYQQAPATAAGQYTISWTAPSDPNSVLRHYNIYALDGSAPTAVQNRRIASVPVGTTSFIDWLGNTSGTTQYLVSAVDIMGNESGVSSSGRRSKINGSTINHCWISGQ